MKNFLILLLFVPLVCIGQDGINLNVDKKIEFSEKNDLNRGFGLNYSGNGVYTYTHLVSKAESGSRSQIEKKWLDAQIKVRTIIMNFINQNNYTYKTVNIEKIRSVLSFTIKVFNKDGSLAINKDEAKKEIIELKELLDLGIITQEEFNTKAVSLKKILLGN